MTKVLLMLFAMVNISLFAESIVKFDLNFSKGHNAYFSAGQASCLRGNAEILQNMLLVKSGFATGASGVTIPYNPLVYSAIDNLPKLENGQLLIEFMYKQFPLKDNYISPIWAIRRVEHTKVTGFCRMQIKFSSRKVSVEYDEFNLDSTKGKTCRISLPIKDFKLGKIYTLTLKLDGNSRVLEVNGQRSKVVKTPWNFAAYLSRAGVIVVGGAYENSGKLLDPKIELLIRRFVISEFDKAESSSL